MNDNNWKKLSKYLAKSKENRVILSFEEIETIIGAKLPEEALKSEWWWNKNTSKRAEYWLSKNYKTINVKGTIPERKITFIKTNNTRLSGKKRNLIYRLIDFIFDEDNPTRKRVAAFLAIPVAILAVLGSVYTIKSYYMNANQENNLFNNYYEMGERFLKDQNFNEAIKYFELSVNTYDDLSIPYDQDSIKAFKKLADIYSKIGLYEKALNCYIIGVSVIESLNLDKEDYIDLYIDISCAYLALTELEKAEEYLDEVKNFFNDDEISVIEQIIHSIYTTYGIDNEQKENVDGTIKEFEVYADENVMKSAVSKLDNYLEMMELEAAFDMRKGDYETAAFRCEQVLSFWNYLKASDVAAVNVDVKIAILYDTIGICCIHFENMEKAREYNQLAISILEDIFGKRNLDTAISYSNIGMAYLETGEYETAHDYLDKSAIIVRGIIGENNELMATAYNNIGLCFEYMNNYEKAEEYYVKAINILCDLGVQNISIIKTYINYADCLFDMNRLSEAYEIIDKAYLLASILLDENNNVYQMCMQRRTDLQFIDSILQQSVQYDNESER